MAEILLNVTLNHKKKQTKLYFWGNFCSMVSVAMLRL